MIAELQTALDFEDGGEIGVSLRRLLQLSESHFRRQFFVTRHKFFDKLAFGRPVTNPSLVFLPFN